MIKRAQLYIFFLSLMLCCVGRGFAQEAAEPEFVVRLGYTFGECVGYCDGELLVEGRKATLKRTSRLQDFRYPPVERERYLWPSEYKILKNLLEATEFTSAEDRYGCPDCYDQGAEWLEVKTPYVERRIEMDYNAVPAPLESLLLFLRKVRARMEEGLDG